MAKNLMIQVFYPNSANPKKVVDYDGDSSPWTKILRESRSLLAQYPEKDNVSLTLTVDDIQYVVTLEAESEPKRGVVDLDELRWLKKQMVENRCDSFWAEKLQLLVDSAVPVD